MSKEKTNPVQVVLNSSNYVEAKINLPGGSIKDFFGGNDQGFIEHKAKIVQQLTSIHSVLSHSNANTVAYVKVRMRKQALAKSHRPTQAIFKPTECPLVGAGDVGELYYKLSQSTLPRILSVVRSAENETRWKTDNRTQELKHNPSRARGEVGAIEEISLPEEADKRNFSVSDGVRWLENERSGRVYIVSLFHLPPTLGELMSYDRTEVASFEQFIDRLNLLPFGVQVFRSNVADGLGSFIFARPTKLRRPLRIADLFTKWNEKMGDEEYLAETDAHNQLIKLLSSDTVVRKIELPPLIESAQQAAIAISRAVSFPSRADGRSYPKIGVVDGGIDTSFGDWLLGSASVIADEHRNVKHGSFITGLLIGAREAGNPISVAKEEDGCDIYDVDVFPSKDVAGAFQAYYPNGFADFFDELELAVAKAKKDHGIRVFNISLNILLPVEETSYGPAAMMLDAIAEKHDVIIVVSAGNLAPSSFRGPWPQDPSKVASYLLPFAAHDRIYQPSESVNSITVGAINPPSVPGQLEDAPAPYTRRGPGMKVGVKPDFCHYGGSVPLRAGDHSGLFSVMPDGSISSGCGTSYAAPLVAKTVACLDHRIEGHVPRETLLGLLVHSALRPKPLDVRELDTISKNFVGFGLPDASEDILLTDENSITLVFNDVLTAGKQMTFDFVWPQKLTAPNGKCRGSAKMTLVYKPIIDSSCGAEFIRVNLDAHLRQSKGDGHFAGRADQVFMSGSKKDAHFESDLIEHGLKWWPTKHYRLISKLGLGKSSNWRLIVDSLLRDGERFPKGGVPFTVILTIADNKGEQPIFDDMRAWLAANSVKLDDIRTATRVRQGI